MVDWEGVDGAQLAKLAVDNPSKASKVLGLVQMYLYAKRHGHGYRVVDFEGKSVTMGSGRPYRHPAWSRVPLLWLLYTGGLGADLILDNPLSGASCSTEDRWMLYLDTDVVVVQTGFNIGDIVEALRTQGEHHPGLPCHEVYNDPTFADPAFMTAAGNRTHFCHHARDQLKGPLAQGVDPATDVAVAGFNDMYFNVQACKAMRDPVGGQICPNPTQDNMCSAIMLWRVPAPKLAATGNFQDSVVKRAITVGKRMVETWFKVRLAPGGDDKEDFLAMRWSSEAPGRTQVVYREGADELRCPITSCGFAGDQTVFNRAVLYGLPHRPWNETDPGLALVGQNLKHTAILKCTKCVGKDQSYSSGEPFFHGTAWKFKRDHLMAWMMKLAYELHGLHYVFPFTQAATAEKKPNPATGELGREVGKALVTHPDTAIREELNKRLKDVCGNAETPDGPCVVEEDMRHSAAVLDRAISAIKDTAQVQMRLNPSFKGVDHTPETEDEKAWYQVFKV